MNNPPKPAGNVQKGAVTFANKSFVGRNVPKMSVKSPLKIMVRALV